mmetsp:Transcript_11983/g.31496  ORF Transcript_11983/g.31496 Transcript_11983/m.31496 type:complete len:120 (+) Transcript_11983:918-1277(+)
MDAIALIDSSRACRTPGMLKALQALHFAGEAHWELLCRARAVECQAFVIAAAQAGKHSEKRESYGHSLIVDPWGTVLTRLNGSETGIAVADLDFERLEAVRQKMPIAHHRQKGHKAYLA